MGHATDILAVDGGGTHCRVACLRDGTRHMVTLGRANVTSDPEGALAEIGRGLDRLAAEMDIPVSRLHEMPAYLGLAGVMSPDQAAAIAARLPLRHARVADDRPAAVEGALGAADGAVFHCGTGSFWAVKSHGATRLAGGWGPVLGDEASALWLGRRALRAALDVADGLAGAGTLSDTLNDRFGGAHGIVAFAAAATATQIAAIAPDATSAADTGDPAARRLMTEGAALIGANLTALGWRPGMAICGTGGLAPCYGPYLAPPLSDALTAPKGAPIDGALALARAYRDELSR